MEYPLMVAGYISQFSYLAIFVLCFFSGYIIPIPEEIIGIIGVWDINSYIISNFFFLVNMFVRISANTYK